MVCNALCIGICTFLGLASLLLQAGLELVDPGIPIGDLLGL